MGATADSATGAGAGPADRDETSADRGEGLDGRPGRWIESCLQILTLGLLSLVAVVPIVGNELRVQDADPVYMRNLVERASHYGGTYYDNAIHNRGQLEPFLYDVASRVISYDGFWFVISLFVALLAAGLGFAAARTARFTGAGRPVALGVAAVVYVQFALADHGYSRVLYIRNITTSILVAVWLLALSERWWSDARRAGRSALLTGALLGLVAQQLLTTVFSGAVVGLVAAALLWERRPPIERAGLVVRASGAAIVAFVATPLWYLARGDFETYWTGWWTYARYMSEGPGRPLGSQFGLGWDRFYEYHLHNPMAAVLVLAFAGVTWTLWAALDRRTRIVHLGLISWFLAGWLELILSQRYSNHYFQVIAVPTALIGAALSGHAARAIAHHRPSVQTSLAVPLAATVLGLYLTGPAIFVAAARDTNRFTSVSAWASTREKNQGGGDRSVQAILDLVSRRNDAMLAWTFDPFVYSKFQRVPATRFQWKFFYQGAIYLGRTSPDYVLPKTWTWFREDVAETRPVAFAETEPFDSGTPFEDLIRSSFREVYPGSAARLWLRQDVATTLLTGSSDKPWSDPLVTAVGSGWTVADDGVHFAAGAQSPDSDLLDLGAGDCRRIDMDVDTGSPGGGADLVFWFSSTDEPNEERQTLAVSENRFGSGSEGLGPYGFETIPWVRNDGGQVHISVVVGRSSAALVVDQQLVAAVRLEPSVTRLHVESGSAALTLSGLRIGPAPAGGGCDP